MKREDLKVIGFAIFAGSASIGVMNNGVKPTHILELTEEQPEDNAMHFIHNYPDIPVLRPSEWGKPEFLKELREQDYDLMYSNPPCSGLSLGSPGKHSHLNEPNNCQYEYMDLVEAVQPKAFMYENAPTLVTTGKPILDDWIRRFDNYKFTILRDFGVYHGVPMRRQRTFVIGWREDIFKEIPTIHMSKEPKTTVGDVLEDLYDVPLGDKSVPNHELIPNRPFQDVEHIFPDVGYVQGVKNTVNWVICNDFDKYEPLITDKKKKSLQTQLYKQPRGLGYWDKSAQRPDPSRQAPSLTGYASFIHPVHHRQFTVREYARLMRFPDSFEFLPHKDIVRHIAQGVPVSYFQWASKNVIEALLGNRESKDEYENTKVVVQNHIKDIARSFTKQEFLDTKKIMDIKKKTEKAWVLEK